MRMMLPFFISVTLTGCATGSGQGPASNSQTVDTKGKAQSARL